MQGSFVFVPTTQHHTHPMYAQCLIGIIQLSVSIMQIPQAPKLPMGHEKRRNTFRRIMQVMLVLKLHWNCYLQSYLYLRLHLTSCAILEILLLHLIFIDTIKLFFPMNNDMLIICTKDISIRSVCCCRVMVTDQLRIHYLEYWQLKNRAEN